MSSSWLRGPKAYFLAVCACVGVTAVASLFWPHLDAINTVMLFLLTVFLIAAKLGRGPAVMAAFLAVALFDIFFVPPHFSFAVSDAQYVLTFAVMLAVGLVTAGLTAGLARETERVREREQQTGRLYALAHELAGAASISHVRKAVSKALSDTPYEAEVHLLDASSQLEPPVSVDILPAVLDSMARNGQLPIEAHYGLGDGRLTLCLPLKALVQVRGVLAVTPRQGQAESAIQDQAQLEAIASLVALVIERLHYVEVAQSIQLQVESERLRASILSALSHDLRTPMTSLVGLADQLALREVKGDPENADLAAVIRDQALAMNQLLANLLDMARLQAGSLQLRKDWQLFEDVVSTSLKFLKPALAAHHVSVRLDPDLPLVTFDAVLLERALSNLIENATKYAPVQTSIEIRGYVEGAYACLSVADRGPGFPGNDPADLFTAFVRGASESPVPGVGLGLAIASAIIAAHGGRIDAANRPDGGAIIVLKLPLGTPPKFESDPA